MRIFQSPPPEERVTKKKKRKNWGGVRTVTYGRIYVLSFVGRDF
jgi:hypothetical protein